MLCRLHALSMPLPGPSLPVLLSSLPVFPSCHAAGAAAAAAANQLTTFLRPAHAYMSQHITCTHFGMHRSESSGQIAGGRAGGCTQRLQRTGRAWSIYNTCTACMHMRAHQGGSAAHQEHYARRRVAAPRPLWRTRRAMKQRQQVTANAHERQQNRTGLGCWSWQAPCGSKRARLWA